MSDFLNNLALQGHPFALHGPYEISVANIAGPIAISTLRLPIGTYYKTVGGVLIFSLRSGNGNEYTVIADISVIKDNAFININLNNFVIHKSLKITITPLYDNPADFIAIYKNSAGVCLSLKTGTTSNTVHEIEPLISIVMPVYKTPLNFLSDAINSVSLQTYKNWELCIVDDGSNSEVLNKYLKTINDKRIKIQINKENKGIASSSNDTLKLATGDYVCFLDHDDTLHVDALSEVVKTINQYPDVKFIYTDEDKLGEDGKYYGAFYKPDWSYDRLLSQNYTCHLSVYDKKIIDAIGGFSLDHDGSQDYDMVLKVSEKISHQQIKHIPKVLYHWRCHKNSTASGIDSKFYTHRAALKAIQEHLQRVGADATIYAGVPLCGTFNVNYKQSTFKSVQIIILTRNNIDYFYPCIKSVLQSSYPNYKVTVVDHMNTDPRVLSLFEDLRKNPKVNIIPYKEEFNFSIMNNMAIDIESDLYLFLNDDTEVITPDWLEQLTQNIGRNGVVMTGPKLLYSNGNIQHTGVVIGMGGIAGHVDRFLKNGDSGYFNRPHIIQNVSAVTGACMLIDRLVFESVGGFEKDLPMAFNDVDLCLKVRKLGHNIVYNPNACLYHHESVSRKTDPNEHKYVKYIKDKWGELDRTDPYYNVNLPI